MQNKHDYLKNFTVNNLTIVIPLPCPYYTLKVALHCADS